MADLGAVGVRNRPYALKSVIKFYDPDVTPSADFFRSRSRAVVDCAYAKSLGTNTMRWSVADSRYQAIDRVPTYIGEQREVRGTVLDEDGVGIDRTVFAINGLGVRVSPIIRSELDGTFRFRVGNSGTKQLLVIALDDHGDHRNAVVKWRVSPVSV